MNPSSDASAPIGLFDSGVGGLTVLAEIARQLANERFHYVADQAHVPYGDRPLAEIERFASDITAHLIRSGAKTVVMACNVSSATALSAMRARFGADRIFGVIEPGVAAALAQSATGRIGVLATASTVRSRAYSRALRARSEGRGGSVRVMEVACPKFVPLVEREQVRTPAAESAAWEYVAPLLAAGVDTAILGCTHYPFLLETLNEVAGGRIRFVDPAVATARALARVLRERGLAARESGGSDHLTTTGSVDLFRLQAQPFFSARRVHYAEIRWRDVDRARALVAAT